MMQSLDADGSGTIDFSEFLNWGAQSQNELMSKISDQQGINPDDFMNPD